MTLGSNSNVPQRKIHHKELSPSKGLQHLKHSSLKPNASGSNDPPYAKFSNHALILVCIQQVGRHRLATMKSDDLLSTVFFDWHIPCSAWLAPRVQKNGHCFNDKPLLSMLLGMS
jgi:hypothetical protein